MAGWGGMNLCWEHPCYKYVPEFVGQLAAVLVQVDAHRR